MEVLTTSDALEAQILEDARNKARRILESADKESAAIRAAGERKLLEETQRLDAAAEARVAALRQELATALPLDFMRARLAFIQDAVSKALNDMFEGLTGVELGRIIGRMLSRAAYAFKDAPVVVQYAGMDGEEARRIVRDSVPGAKVEDVQPLSSADAEAAGKGIILQTTDGSRRYRGTLNEMKNLLLEEYREESVTALLGKDVQK